MKKINCFIPAQSVEQIKTTVEGLKASELVADIYLLANEPIEYEGCNCLVVDSLNSSATVAKIAAHSDAEFSLIYTKYTTLEFGQYGIERFYNLAAGAGVGMIYSDYYGAVPNEVASYVKLAKAFLDDKDAPNGKAFIYYYNLIK